MAYSDGHPVVTCVPDMRRDVAEGKGAARASKPGSPRDLHVLTVSCRSCSFSLGSRQNMADQNLEKHPRDEPVNSSSLFLPNNIYRRMEGRLRKRKQIHCRPMALSVFAYIVDCPLKLQQWLTNLLPLRHP